MDSIFSQETLFKVVGRITQGESRSTPSKSIMETEPGVSVSICCAARSTPSEWVVTHNCELSGTTLASSNKMASLDSCMKVGLNLIDAIYGLREISTFELDIKKQVKDRLLSTRKILVVIRFT